MSAETDLQNFKAYLEDFEFFLKSNDVFGQSSAPNAPALSLGGVLFLQCTLTTRLDQLSPSQRTEFASLERQLTELLNKWAAHVAQKALKEISNRLNVWESAFEELAEHYSTSVSQRVYLALLMPFVSSQPEVTPFQERLQKLDARLQAKFITGEFAWAKDLQIAFPPESFWFLYGKARG